jgi:2,3-diketo-5-methylthio-1-phosphopentane phosphatase
MKAVPASREKHIHIFCDFDGTITRHDTGDEFFKQFADFEPHHADLMMKRTDVREYYRRVTATLRATQQDIDHFAAQAEIDAYCSDFLSFVEQKGWSFTILSDGFENYIRPIVKRITSRPVHIRANKLILSETDSNLWRPVFPYADESCNCFCASCKRNQMLSLADSLIIYIGDGLSDTCPAAYADMVFAKNKLAAYCNQNGIMHHPWSSFFDIRMILSKRLPSVRDYARKLRQKAFECE